MYLELAKISQKCRPRQSCGKQIDYPQEAGWQTPSKLCVRSDGRTWRTRQSAEIPLKKEQTVGSEGKGRGRATLILSADTGLAGELRASQLITLQLSLLFVKQT